MSDPLSQFLRVNGTQLLRSRAQIIAAPYSVPAIWGIYGWCFRELPSQIDVSDCTKIDGLTLLYVGIAPDRPSSNSNLNKRIVSNHCRGNAAGSTLRLSLGCLLAERLDLTLRMHVSGKERLKKYTFGSGETALNQWMDQNAFVTWTPHEAPWHLENIILKSGLSLPLNGKGNPNKNHKSVLSKIRREAKAAARDRWEAPI